MAMQSAGHDAGYEAVSGVADSAVVLHIPHSAAAIPADVRAGICLDDAALELELLRMTDSHTRAIAEAALANAPGAWLFANRLSRLVIDPERFTDDTETMEQVGMGAVYTGTHDRGVLRTPTAAERQLLLDTYFWPYANALEELVRERLEACGRVVIIDLHSYPTQRLPYEISPDGPRPPICIGADDFHTSPALLEAAIAAFSGFGEVAVNSPFAGTYVPTAFYQRDPRVQSVMIEIRRDQYMDEQTGEVRPIDLMRLGRSLGELAISFYRKRIGRQ